MVVGTMNWKQIQKEVESAVIAYSHEAHFVKTKWLAHYILEHAEDYPACGDNIRTIHSRVTNTFLKDPLGHGWKGWSCYKERIAQVWVVPVCIKGDMKGDGE